MYIQWEINILKLKFDHFGILAPFYERFIPPTVPEKLLALVNLPADGIVLDAGGGTGRVAQFLCDKASQVIVADLSLEMLKEAQKKEGLHAICSYTENSPFADNCFDGIIMVDAFHHVANQRKTANDLWQILKPGGRIVIEEPDVRSFRVKLIALAEKLALMRSHFLAPPQIADLFHFPSSRVQINTEGTNAWIIVEKESG
jgi:ubiquinone/menaquinone biosynthesis C-methylase UbiE